MDYCEKPGHPYRHPIRLDCPKKRTWRPPVRFILYSTVLAAAIGAIVRDAAAPVTRGSMLGGYGDDASPWDGTPLRTHYGQGSCALAVMGYVDDAFSFERAHLPPLSIFAWIVNSRHTIVSLEGVPAMLFDRPWMTRQTSCHEYHSYIVCS